MNDDELRARFGELRAADARGAPDFRSVLAHARSGSARRRWLSPLAISVAAAAVVVAAVGIARVSQRAAFVAPPLSGWTSPTAGLLRTPAFDRARPASVISTLVVIATASDIPRTGSNR